MRNGKAGIISIQMATGASQVSINAELRMLSFDSKILFFRNLQLIKNYTLLKIRNITHNLYPHSYLPIDFSIRGAIF